MGLFSRFKKSEDTPKKSRSAQLEVGSITKLTAVGCQVSFIVPEELKANYSFEAGQYLNLHCEVNGEVLSRSYSICSGKDEALSVAVKAIEGGKVSNWILNHLKPGMQMEVDFPQGNFKLSKDAKKVVAFVAGSGITPILSMAKSLSDTQQMELFYGNRTQSSTFFQSEIKALKNVNAQFYFSQETVEGAHKGKLDKETISEIIKADLSLLRADGFYICGPEAMIIAIQEALLVFGVEKSKVHFELFTTPVLMKQETTTVDANFEGMSSVSAMMDGEVVKIQLSTKGKSLLDALDGAGMDVPFSCKGGVCCTCKAKIVEGSARMNMNYALTDEEVKEGYILTCQAHPTSEVLKISFDV